MSKLTPKKKNRKSPIVDLDIQKDLDHFFKCHAPKKFQRGLRNMVIELVSYQKGCYPEYLQEMLLSLEMFFPILDRLEDAGNYDT